jgi:hypothetical protein
MTNRSFAFLFFFSLALTLNIISDSYLNLSPQGYTFTFTGFKPPVELNITGLPQGLTLQNYTVVPVSAVEAGQYILSVKASDASSQAN